MKRVLSIQMLLLIAIMSKGQETVLSFAPTLNNVFHYQFVEGGPNANSRPGFNVAYEHVRSTTNRVSYGYGVSYQFSQVKLVPAPMIEREPHVETINLITASFKTVFNFRKGYYLSTDPLIDIQLNSSSQKSIRNQSGAGISIGYGRRVLLNKRFSINIEPRVWVHNVVPFVDTNIPERLTVIGLKAGLKLGQNQ
ncbi:MAG TPA: hypothetical protein VFG54_09665 [Prolixibacteraceae bacterium]|nr:hypothetical protein [Prolixibacteraceae bacterium]